METPEIVIAVITALGVGTILGKVADFAIKLFTGRKAKEREGWEAADQEAKLRRQYEVWAHRTYITGVRHGFAHLLPPMPNGTPTNWETPNSILE